MIRERFSEDDLALLEVLEDPIWCGEFLRTTNYGEVKPEMHAKKPWFYRDYQRQFLSDKSEFIVYMGGRAIGKCQPPSARILTNQGYRTISELLEEPSIIVYALDKNGSLTQKRAVIAYDSLAPVYRVTLENGTFVDVTDNHPLLTEAGYKALHLIDQESDRVAVATMLPWESNNNALSWHELRMLGYYIISEDKTIIMNRWVKPKFRAVDAELQELAKELHVTFKRDRQAGMVMLRKPNGPYRHALTSLYSETGVPHESNVNTLRKLPRILMMERLENLRIFLEAVFAQHGTLSKDRISLKLNNRGLATNFAELLLRFGIETRMIPLDEKHHDGLQRVQLETLDYRAAYRFWKELKLPGVRVGTMELPEGTTDAAEHLRFVRVESIEQIAKSNYTYAIHVYGLENYISDNVYVHNTVVLQDRTIYELVNSDIEFPETTQSLLVTPNQAQMTPLLQDITGALTGGKLLKSFLDNKINRSQGVMQLYDGKRPKPHIFHFRIAGSGGEQNMVGLHIPRIRGDEMQLFPMSAFTQLRPAYNQWEEGRQQSYSGVPNGLRNTVLWQVDHNPRFKRYRIASHNNPNYSFANDQENIKLFGGEHDDRYQQLVLGRHGNAAYQVIPIDSFVQEPVTQFPFYSISYNSDHVNKGIDFKDHLDRPSLGRSVTSVIAVDPGYVDSTIVQIFGQDDAGVWRTHARYRLTRINAKDQQDIIHWLATYYNSPLIAFDAGSGGQGSAIMHNLIHGEGYAHHRYEQRVVGVQFAEKVITGYDDVGNTLTQDSKGYATTELARMVAEKQLVFSELDFEGISELSRVARTRTTSERDRYYVLNDRGKADAEDHIYACYVVFVLAIRSGVAMPTNETVIGGAQGGHTVNRPKIL